VNTVQGCTNVPPYKVSKVKVALKQATKAQRGSGVTALLFSLISALVGKCVVNATLRPFYPPGRPGTHCTGGWLVRMAGVDGCGKYRPHRDSIPGQSSPQKFAVQTELSRPNKCCAAATNDCSSGN